MATRGLRVISLRTAIPELQLQRFRHLQQSTSNVCSGAYEGALLSAVLGKAGRSAIYDGWNLIKKDLISRYWVAELHQFDDRRALCRAAEVPSAHRWVEEGHRLQTGRAFIENIKLRINAHRSASAFDEDVPTSWLTGMEYAWSST